MEDIKIKRAMENSLRKPTSIKLAFQEERIKIIKGTRCSKK